MEDKKENEQQNQDMSYSEQMKQKVDSTKNKTKKIKKIIEFLKKHPLIAKVIFWVVSEIVMIIVFVSIIYVVLGDKAEMAEETMEITTEAMQNMLVDLDTETEDGMEDLAPEISCVESGATIKDGKYYLIYDDYDEDEKKRRVEEIKKILKKQNIEIYSNQCLLFLYTLHENGLQINQYKKEELEAMYMFYKAEIATSSLDLRTVDEMYEKDENGNDVYQYPENSIVPQYEDSSGKVILGYDKETYDENDYSDDSVCGTVRVQRITYKDETETKTGKVNYLTYIPLEEFNNLVKRSQEKALDHFSIDSENNLIIARWENFESEYTFSGLEEYSSDEQARIKALYENKERYRIHQYRSIPYMESIDKYTLDFNLLMTLLTTTEDSDFCKEFAKLAEKSYMVMTLHEEHTVTNTTNTITHTDNELIYATVNFKYSVTVPSNEQGKPDIEKNGSFSNLFVTKNRGLVGSGYPVQEISNLPPILENGEGLSVENLKGLTQYTKKAIKQYEVLNKIKNEKNMYNLEITEVDNWYEYYNKKYSQRIVREIKPEPEEKEEESEITQNSTGKRSISGHSSISQLDYIQQISSKTKEELIKEATKLDQFKDQKIEYTQVEENYFSYGFENVHTEIIENSYSRGRKSTETVQVKVQKNNKLALLTLATDELTIKEDEEEQSDEEKIYETTDELTNGFLYVYDKHKDAQKALKSIDEWVYKMIDSVDTTNLLKYLLFLYDGTDFGVTEYNLNLFRPEKLKSPSQKLLLIKYIRALGDYMAPPTNFEGTCYIIEKNKNGDLVVGYGVNIEKSGYKDQFEAAGYKLEVGAEVPIDFVDAIEEELIERTKEEVKAFTSGLNLKEYQINALVSRVYHSGTYKDLAIIRDGKDFLGAYEAYWNQETDDKYQEKDNNANFEHELYTKYMSLPVSSDGVYMPELAERRRSEWILFQTGYYDVVGEWHIAGGKIIEWAKIIHEYMEENQYIYCVYFCNDGEECDDFGERCGLNVTFEESKTGYHHTCCSNFVSWVLQEAGYFTREEHSNGVGGVELRLKEKKWQVITDVDLLEPGDILFFDGHTEIYAGDGMIYNAGSGNAIRGASPAKKQEGFGALLRAYRAPD